MPCRGQRTAPAALAVPHPTRLRIRLFESFSMSTTSHIPTNQPFRGKLLSAVVQRIADLGGWVMDWIIGVGSISTFSLRTFRLAVRPAAAPRDAHPRLLPDWREELAGGGPDRHLYRHGAGGAKLRAVSQLALGSQIGGGHQPVAGPRAWPRAGRHHARRPRGQRHGRRTGHHARHRADRRVNHHGRQPHSLFGSAPVPRLPAADSGLDDHGRLHGRAGSDVLRRELRGIDFHHYLENSQHFVGLSTCLPACSKACFLAPPLP